MVKMPPYRQGQVAAIKRLRKGFGTMVIAAKRKEVRAASAHGAASSQAEKALAERMEMEAAYKLMAIWMRNRMHELEG